jgi:hypothetical protein
MHALSSKVAKLSAGELEEVVNLEMEEMINL